MQNLLDSHLISASFESEDLSDSDDFSHAEAFNNVWFPDDVGLWSRRCKLSETSFD